VRYLQWHNPAFWLYWMLVIGGAYLFYGTLSNSKAYPTALGISLLFQSFYCLPWVWFLTRRDRYEVEPAKLAALGFLWGGLVATMLMAMPGNDALLSILLKTVSLQFHDRWGAAIVAPIVEEPSKYVGLIMLALLARSHVRSAYDGFLLGAFVGLGFQVFENFQYQMGAAAGNFGSQQARDALSVGVERAITGLWSHAMFTAIAGTGLGYFLSATNRSMRRRLAVATAFMLTAMLSHGLFDAASAFLPLALLGVVVGTIGVIAAWRFAESRQRQWIRVILAGEEDAGTITANELDVLAGPAKQRRRFLKAMRRTEGSAAATQESFVLDAEIDLAAALASTENAASPEAARARAEVTRLRGLLHP
jgi:RsiW-degrading membrane proteinase PrsW (M82 family)